MVERLFLAVPRGCLQFVIVVFPDHTHLLFLFVQMSLSDVDSVRARKILGMQMAVLSLSCYTQPLNNRIFIVHDFFG